MGDDVPPPAETSWTPPCKTVKTIRLSRVQNPPESGFETSHICWGGPPDASIFLSFLPPTNAMKRLSGDQKGGPFPPTSSVPGSARMPESFSERIQRRLAPSAPVAMNTSCRPSGERL